MINNGTGRWDRSRPDGAAKRLETIRKMLASGCGSDAVMERFRVTRDHACDLIRAAKQTAVR